jgi:alkanesulfonate monooxygenase SsuD/methylene tetrahydromethanopterin reductase-like flavin-dependent oxidoreductase (luciferase family)
MTTRPSLGFGLFFSAAGKSLQQILDEFQMAEDLGFDHAWLPDHVKNPDGPPTTAMHETWTALTAVAARTSRIRFGTLVSSNTFRHPVMLLKQAVTVDHVSAGRLVLGVGAGWFEEEHRRFGIDFPAPAERVARLEEAVRIIRLLMDEGHGSFAGRYYRLDDAYLVPSPFQQPRIPLLIAAHRPRMLAIAARYADQWDTFAEMPGAATEGVTEDVADQLKRLDEACRTVGRDPATIRRSLWTRRDTFRSEQTYVDFVERSRAAGFTDFSVDAPSSDDWPMIRRIAEGVLPGLRAGDGHPDRRR